MTKKVKLRKDFMRVCQGDYALHITKNEGTILIAEKQDIYYKAA